MKLPTLYLAGPIANCSDAECNDWREKVIQEWENHGMQHQEQIINPMTRDYRGQDMTHLNKVVVELDKREIRKADVLFVYFTKISVGTSMEILYAWEQGKVIVLIDARPQRERISEAHQLSPWLLYHATTVWDNIELALDWVRENVSV